MIYKMENYCGMAIRQNYIDNIQYKESWGNII